MTLLVDEYLYVMVVAIAAVDVAIIGSQLNDDLVRLRVFDMNERKGSLANGNFAGILENKAIRLQEENIVQSSSNSRVTRLLGRKVGDDAGHASDDDHSISFQIEDMKRICKD